MSLAQLRKDNPQFAGYSDDALIGMVANQTGKSIQEVSSVLTASNNEAAKLTPLQQVRADNPSYSRYSDDALVGLISQQTGKSIQELQPILFTDPEEQDTKKNGSSFFGDVKNAFFDRANVMGTGFLDAITPNPSISTQAEMQAEESANKATAEIPGAPVRESAYNQALLRRNENPSAGIGQRIEEAASGDISGQMKQEAISRSMSDSPPKPDGGFIPSAKSIAGQTIKGVGRIGSDYLGYETDNPIAEYGQRIIDANPVAVRELGDIKDDPFLAFSEATGNAAGGMAGMVAAKAAGMGITTSAPLFGPAAPVVAAVGQFVQWLGPAAVAALPSYSGIRDSQILKDPENEDDAKSKAIAALGAGAVGAIETAFGPQQWALAAMTREGRSALARKFAATSRLEAIAKASLKGAVIEGAEEIAQSPIEQLASYDNPLSRESIDETLFGGAMGALGGLGAGAATGAITPLQTAQSKASQINAERQNSGLQKIAESQSVDEAIDAAAESVSQKPVTTQDIFDDANARNELLKKAELINQQKGGINEETAAQGLETAKSEVLASQNSKESPEITPNGIVAKDDVISDVSQRHGENKALESDIIAQNSGSVNVDEKNIVSDVSQLNNGNVVGDLESLGSDGLNPSAMSDAAKVQDEVKYQRSPSERLKDNERSNRLQRLLNKAGHEFRITTADMRDFAILGSGSTQETEAAEQIAGIFKKRITPIKADGQFRINGVIVPSINDTIFIDVRTDKATHAVMGHELSHHMEQDVPEVYNTMVGALKNIIQNEHGYRNKYRLPENETSENVIKEIVGDIVGDNFTQPEFWNKVAVYNPNAFRKIADAIISWIKKLVTNAKMRGLGSEQWVTDAQKAQDIVAKAVAQYTYTESSFNGLKNKAMFQTAWHGSPYDHDKFSTDKIGTGEGAHAYGFGLYFTDKKEIADFYRKSLSELKGSESYTKALNWLKDVGIYSIGDTYTTMPSVIAEEHGDIKKSLDRLRFIEIEIDEYNGDSFLDFLDNPNDRPKVTLRKYDLESNISKDDLVKNNITKDKQYYDKLRAVYESGIHNIDVSEDRGKLYQVELAPEQDEYLLWDKPLSEQSDKVRNALSGNIPEYKEKAGILEVNKKLVEKSPGTELTGRDLYNAVKMSEGSQEKASAKLHSLGIRGIKYLDGTSRGKGKGSFNYVIFDDKDVEIKAKFSFAGQKSKTADKQVIENAPVPANAGKVSKFATLSDLIKSWNDKQINSFVSERNGIITLSKIIIPKEQRNGGLGTAAMNELVQYADRTGQRIVLTPSSDFGGAKLRLFSFYKKFGFVENKGKNKDYSTSESMYRDPKENTKFSRSAPIPETITIDGKERPTRNSEGKLIHPTEEGIRNFYAWFQNSKVVDDEGRPRIVYHGSPNDFNIFSFENMGKQGTTEGHGLYFTADKGIATGYANGGRLFETYLKVTNPYSDKIRTITKTNIKNTLNNLYKNDPDALSNYGDVDYQGFNSVLNEAIKIEDNAISDADFIGSLINGGIAPLEDVFSAFTKATKKDGVITEWLNPDKSGNVEIIVVTNPNQIKSATDNTGQFSQDNDDIRFSRTDTLSQAGVNTEETAKPADIPEETKMQAFRRRSQDAMLRFKVMKNWLKEQGINITEAADVYQRENISKGKQANKIEDFRRDQLEPLIKRIAETSKKSLKKEGKFDLADIATYLEAVHIPEANERMRLIHKNDKATANGITDAQAKKVIKQFEAMPNFSEFKKLADEIRVIGSETLDMRLEAGLISQEQYDAYKATYQNWVPLRGNMSGQGFGKGLSTNAKDKRRMGHGFREEEFVIENIVQDRERAILQIEKNKVGMSVATFLMEAENENIGTVGKPEKMRVMKDFSYAVNYKGKTVGSFETEAGARNAIERITTKRGDLGLDGESFTEADFSVDKTYDPHIVMMAKPQLSDNEIQVYVNGHAIRLQLNDPLMARAATNAGIEQVGAIAHGARMFNRFLSKAYTAWSPDFLFMNMARDAYSGTLVLTGKKGAAFAAKTFTNYGTAINELIKGRKDPSKSKWVSRYREAGGNIGAAYLSDLERVGEDAVASLQEFAGARETYRMVYNEQISKGASEKKARSMAALKAGMAKTRALPFVGNMFQILERVNMVIENALRLATFKTAIESGESDQQAAMLSKDLMNFNRKGEVANQMGALYLFYNPGMQGAHIVGEALFTSKHKAQVWSLLGALTTVSFMLAELGRGGDDDDDRTWENTPEYIKDRNLIINVGDNQITIPVAYGFGIFHAMGNYLSDLNHGAEPSEIAVKLASGMFENFSVFGNPIIDDDSGIEIRTDQLLPTLPKIIMAPGINMDGLGRKIQPDKAFWNESMPDSQNMFRSVRGTLYEDIASFMNDNTGGSKYNPGAIDISPNTIKYWVTSLTGGAGRFVSDITTGAMDIGGGVSPELENTPVLRKFMRQPGVTDSRAGFWKAAKEAQAAAERFNRAVKDGDVFQSQKFLEENQEIIALAKYSEKQSKAASMARNMIQDIQTDKDMSKAEKRLKIREIEIKEQRIYEEFLVAFDVASKKAKK